MLEAYLLTYGSFFLWPPDHHSYSFSLIGIELLFSLINGAGKPNDLRIPPSRVLLLFELIEREMVHVCTRRSFARSIRKVERERDVKAKYTDEKIFWEDAEGKIGRTRTKVKSVIAPTFAVEAE